ncbi:MAG: nuclear transport factor 2 family protein [Gammaproteobacteria bacterium]
MKKLMILLSVLLTAGCMQVPPTDLEGLKAMQDVWQSAFDAKDPARLAAIYAEDGALLPPNSERISGRAAIEAYWAEFQASGIGAEITDTEVYAHSDIGYSVGTLVATDAGGATLDEGKYVVIWRNVDGEWQIHRDIWNSSLPLPAPE